MTFAVVAAAASVAVAATSYFLLRRATLQRATAEAVREAQLALDEAAALLPPAPTVAEVDGFHAGLRLPDGPDGAQVVTLLADGSFATTSFSLSAASVPTALRQPVADGRVVALRTTVEGSPHVVVGGRVLPDGPSSFFFFPLDEDFADLALVRNVLAAVSAVLVVLSAGVGVVASRSVLQPIRRTRDAVQGLEEGVFETRLPEEGRDELADLARSFNHMAETLQSTIAELRDLEADHRRFVADVSHELRTPLTALTTAADLLEAHDQGLDDTGRRAARLLVVETRRLRALVEDLMEISRLDAGAAVMSWAPVDVAAAVTAALEARGWKERVGTHLAAGIATWADPRRLDTIVANLVGNALQHGRPPVIVEAAVDGEHVVIEVTDGGDGIAAEHLAHVFDRFYKADASRPRSEGSGLGLAIARENAHLHGGDVTVSSGSGGTTFTVVLPLRTESPEPEDLATPSVA
ncbi:MAG: HAMP domain-containing histidine kinase [Actinomycetota bacterium]|nr:HAMP domain-containing histidine kinase [Actinomycetota bacterium]MDP9021037.1 HAMP domain-containing histidine kinase [Actinomycetota bacterium]